MKRALGILLAASLSVTLYAPVLAEQQKPAENLLPAPQETPLQAPSEIKAAIPNHPRQVLKHEGHFLIMDETGLMPGDSNIGCGLYRDDTRYLSEWDLSLNGETLTLLSANTEPGFAGRFIYGNKGPRQKPLDKLLPEQSVSVQRDIVISNAMRERIVLTNYGVQTQDVQLKITFASDFADMFEVRGQKRKNRGAYIAPVVDKERNSVALCYQGLDDVPMKTLISFSKTKPTTLTADHAEYELSMPAKSTVEIETVVASKYGREASV